jgi:25S rRNA (uracil2634-N3)-methyltransferase
MAKKSRPIKGMKGAKALKLGKAAKKALLTMPKKEREMVVAGLSKGNMSNWSARMLREGLEPKGKKKVEEMGHVNHQTARAYFTKPGQRILLVGEGNFSFAIALLNLMGGNGERLTCTAYDSMAVLKEKYKDAADNIRNLTNAGATVHLEVDGTELEESGSVVDKNYDLVIFNFPHVGLGIKEQNDNIEVNQALIKAYLLSAVEVVHSTGLVCVTVKRGEPYDSWKVARIGLALPGVKLKTAVDFKHADFPAYTHRRTSGHSPEHAGDDNEIIRQGAKTYIFAPDSGPPKKSKDEDDDDEGTRRCV